MQAGRRPDLAAVKYHQTSRGRARGGCPGSAFSRPDQSSRTGCTSRSSFLGSKARLLPNRLIAALEETGPFVPDGRMRLFAARDQPFEPRRWPG